MPANLTHEYRKAEQSYREAATYAEKLAALELMLATIPKHKGTDKMQGDIKRRIARLRAEGGSTKKARYADPYHVDRCGAGQVVLIGLPNAGKSAIVASVTKAPVVVAAYPFSTHQPVPGMAAYQDVQIQLIDMPPYTEHGYPPGMVAAIRSADLIVLVVDGSADPLEELDFGLKLLAERKIVPLGANDASGDDPSAETDMVWEMPILVVVAKVDLMDEADQTIETLAGLYPQIELMTVSSEDGQNLSALVHRMFELIDVVRVYAKPPGKKPDMTRPFVLSAGSTVMDFAKEIHRDFPENLRSARVWGEGKYPGQHVPRDYVLQDRDVLEVHI